MRNLLLLLALGLFLGLQGQISYNHFDLSMQNPQITPSHKEILFPKENSIPENQTLQKSKSEKKTNEKIDWWEPRVILLRDTDDSIKSRLTFTYDENENLLTRIEEKRSSGGVWSYSARDTSTYNEKGALILKVSEEWNSEKQAWVYSKRYVYTYDAEGNLLFQGPGIWNSETNAWENENWDQRFSYTYDGNGKRITKLSETYVSKWDTIDLITYIYDAEGRLSKERVEIWEKTSKKWCENSSIEYTYDANGNCLTATTRKRDVNAENLTMLDYHRNVYTYNDLGNCLTKLSEYWDGKQGAWIGANRFTCTYDQDGNVLTEFAEYMSSSGNFVGNYIYEYAYDVNGKLLERIRKNVKSQGVLENKERHAYTYDAQGNCTEWVSQYWYEEWKVLHAGEFHYDENGNTVRYKYTDSYYLSGFYYNNMKSYYEFSGTYGEISVEYIQVRESKVAIENTLDHVDVQMYSKGTHLYVEAPNLKEASIEVLDVLGRVLCKDNLSSRFSVKLPKQGVYIVRITDKNIQFAVRKIGVF